MNFSLHTLKRQVPLFLAGMGLLAFSMALFVLQPRFLTQVENGIHDGFMERTSGGPISDLPVIVDLDEASIKRFGQWPWSRLKVAMLLETLANAGAAAIGLDILFSEADRSSPGSILRSLKEDLGMDVTLSGLPPELYNNDALLGEVIRNYPIVMGDFVLFDKKNSGGVLPAGLSFAERMRANGVPAAETMLTGTGMATLVPELQDAGPVGFFNMTPDKDGIVRRVPLVIRVADKVYASLGLRTLMMGAGIQNVRLNSGPSGLESLHVGPYKIPVTPDGYMLVPFAGPSRTFPYISAADVLSPDFNPEQVRGKVVFLGTSAVGLMDIRATPMDRYTPGVEVHTNVVSAILLQRFLSPPQWAPAMQAGVILLCGLLSTVLFLVMPPVWAMLTCVALAGGVFGGSLGLFVGGVVLSPLWGMLTLLVNGTGLMGLRLWTTEAEKRRLRNVFSRYVSPEVVRRIVDRGETVLLGEERELTIMFTDLRGFTSLSEGLTPEQVVALLNRYFTPMTGLIRASEGTLDKFIGDALMAFWNAPLDVPDHPRRAVRTALDMLDTLDALNPLLQQEFGITLCMGAGMHTGTSYVGNMGSEELTSYTALGDAVNLASRLEGLCSRYGVTLVVSEETARQCGEDIALMPLAKLRVKGRSMPVEVFAVFRPAEAEARRQEIDAYTRVRGNYLHAIETRNTLALQEAAAAFTNLVARYPGQPLYTNYAEACTRLLDQPCAEWTEVWTLTDK